MLALQAAPVNTDGGPSSLSGICGLVEALAENVQRNEVIGRAKLPLSRLFTQFFPLGRPSPAADFVRERSP